MTYVFQRLYVDEGNKGYLKGSNVPENFPKEKIDALIASSIILGVESSAEFLGEIIEDAEIEKLDPERKPKGKKV